MAVARVLLKGVGMQALPPDAPIMHAGDISKTAIATNSGLGGDVRTVLFVRSQMHTYTRLHRHVHLQQPVIYKSKLYASFGYVGLAKVPRAQLTTETTQSRASNPKQGRNSNIEPISQASLAFLFAKCLLFHVDEVLRGPPRSVAERDIVMHSGEALRVRGR